MKKWALVAALAAISLSPSLKADTGFTGAFDYQNFMYFSQGGGGGYTSNSSILSLTGPQAPADETSANTYFSLIADAYNISFDWEYSTTSSQPLYNQAGYIADGQYIQLSTDGGSQTQSGSESLTLEGGYFGIFAFVNNIGGLGTGQGTITITNFTFTLIEPPTYTWTGSAGNSWNASENWDGGIPNSATVRAEFGVSGETVVSVGSFIDVGQIGFTPGASSYAITIESFGGLTLNRAGIINNSGTTQTISNIDGGSLTFNGQSTAGDALIINSGASSLTFNETSSAGNAVIQNEGTMNFLGSSSAGNATISVKGMSSSFYDDSTAGTANITIEGGFLSFTGNATSGSATITNDAGGLSYYHTSSADDTTINLLTFSGLNLDNLTASTLRVGSLSGAADSYISLSSKNLTIGGLNTSTTIASEIYDDGNSGSLTKVGTGTLTLSGSNAFSGLMRINQGTVVAQSHASVLGTGTVRLAGGNLSLANDSGLNFGRPTLVSNNGTITSDRISAGAGVTHTLGNLSIGAQTLTVARGANVTSGTAGLSFGSATLTGNATLAPEAGTQLTLASITYTGGSGRSLTVNGAGNTTVTGGVNTGTGRLTKSGSGRLTLSGSGNYSGGTIVNSGTLSAGNNNAVGTGSVTVNGGSFVVETGVNISNTVNLAGGNYVRRLGNNASLANAVNVTSSFAGGTPNTTATILSGTTSGVTEITATFADGGSEPVESDILSLSGVRVVSGSKTDIFVLQLSLTSVAPGSYLGWLNGADQWVNAALGNFDNTASGGQLGYSGSFSTFQSTYGTNLAGYVGAWGFTSTGVWAVLNHNSDFAILPEPGSAALLGFGAMLLLARRNRQPKTSRK